mmetsp:Transcript_1884/g.5315  ORF Transcript_1884/g.5315 Transcript_1884/m.5315 type:complete len:233 (+) Transcript_1884:199-897(+)
MRSEKRNFAILRAALLVGIFVQHPDVLAFRSLSTLTRPSLRIALITSSHDRYYNTLTRSSCLQSQGYEEEYRLINADSPEESRTKLGWRQRLNQSIRVDRKHVAELGISFMLTYNLVSNVNGSIFFSLAWYISSVRTGLSPLAPGNWKALLAAYAGLYVFVTLLRPLRLALAVGMTRRVAKVLDRTQERLGCTKAVSVGFIFSAMLFIWVLLVSCGVTLASTLSGVPIWKGL